MNNALVMGGRHGVGQRDGDGQELVDGQTIFRDRQRQLPALDDFHGQQQNIVTFSTE